MSALLIISHCPEEDHYRDPIDVVGNDRAICCRVLPTENGIEDTPSAAAVDLRIAALELGVRPGSTRTDGENTHVYMPHTLADIIRARSASDVVEIRAEDLVPLTDVSRSISDNVYRPKLAL